MDRLDKRTVLGRAVLERYQSVLSDLGGEDALTTIKRSLVRRFTWFEVMIEGMECRAAAGEGVDIGAWTQLTNSWLGIARMLGLERQARPLRTLRDVMAEPPSYAREPPADEPEPASAADTPRSEAPDTDTAPEPDAAPEPLCDATEGGR